MIDAFSGDFSSVDGNFLPSHQFGSAGKSEGQSNSEPIVETENSSGAAVDSTPEEVTVVTPLRVPRKGGNRRSGSLRVGNSKHPGRNTPASEDPVVIKRRELAMPLWVKGMTAGQIRDEVNAWLKKNGHQPVSAETIRRDKVAVYGEWEADYEATSAQSRLQHIASLHAMKASALKSYHTLVGKTGGNTAAAQFLKLAIDAETSIAELDGTKKRAELHAIQETETFGASRFTRVYLNVDTADLKPDQRATPLIIEGEAKSITLLPPPEEKDAHNR